MRKYVSPKSKEIELLHETIIAASGANAEEDFGITQQEAGAEVLSFGRQKKSIWVHMDE